MIRSKYLLLIITALILFKPDINAQTVTITNKIATAQIPFDSTSVTITCNLTFTNVIGKNYSLRVTVDGTVINTYLLTTAPPAGVPVTLTAGSHSIGMNVHDNTIYGVPKICGDGFTVLAKFTVRIENNFSGGVVNVFNNTEAKSAPYDAPMYTGESNLIGAVDQNDGSYNRVWNSSGTNNSNWDRKKSYNDFAKYQTAKSFNYSVENTDMNARFRANLKKVYNVNVQRSSHGGGIIRVTQNGTQSTITPPSQTYYVVEGNQITAEAIAETQNGVNFVFQNWSDGVTTNPRTISPADHSGLTAVFKGYPLWSGGDRNLNYDYLWRDGAFVHIVWNEHPNPNVVYRVQVQGTLEGTPYSYNYGSYPHGTPSFTDPIFVWRTASNSLLQYNVLPIYAPDNTIKNDLAWLDPFCVEMQKRNANANTNSDLIITKYSVSNYPNPFNPSTVINYQVLESGYVTLKVYDIMGKEIATLVDGTKTKGSYNVNFSMDKYHLASGIYIARFTAGKNMLTTKMILSK